MYEDSESPQSSSSDAAPAPAQAPARVAAAPVTIRCAYCGTRFEKGSSPVMPFCSVRCHRIDLGMWLNESYGLPHEGGDDSFEDFE